MKKPFKHTDLSNQVCAVKGCNRKIKSNVLARKGNTNGLICYKHWRKQWVRRQDAK